MIITFKQNSSYIVAINKTGDIMKKIISVIITIFSISSFAEISPCDNSIYHAIMHLSQVNSLNVNQQSIIHLKTSNSFGLLVEHYQINTNKGPYKVKLRKYDDSCEILALGYSDFL